MKRIRIAIMLLSLILLAAASSPAQQGQDMPPTLKTLFGLAPGCSVLDSMQMMDIEMCQLDCGTQKSVAVARFYNDRMAAQGFTIQDFVEHSEGATVVGSKGMSTAGADVGPSGGKTMATLTVDHIKSLGGTPVGQQVIQGGGQAPAQGSTPTPMAQDQTQPQTASQMAPTNVVEGDGLADEIWQLVSPRSGDTVQEELKLHDNPVAVLTTQSSIDEVLSYYRDALLAKGWMKASYMVQADGGIVIMVTDKKQFQVICDTSTTPAGGGMEYSVMMMTAR